MTTIPLVLVLTLLAAHWIGDWELQSDWMALNKSKSWYALFVHVAVVTATYGVFTYALAVTTLGWVVFVLVNGVLHFAVDAVTSRMTSRLWFLKHYECNDWKSQRQLRDGAGNLAWYVRDTGTRHQFFATIGRDQLLHYVTLMWTAWWLLL